MRKRWIAVGAPIYNSMYHLEAMAPNMLTNIFGTAAGTALQTHLEKNGHPLSFYLIQKFVSGFRVLEISPTQKQNIVGEVPFKN